MKKRKIPKYYKIKSKNISSDALKFSKNSSELWISSATTIMLRTQKFALNTQKKGRQSNEEARRMVNEKMDAMLEAQTAWMNLVINPFVGCNTWRSGLKLMAPFHKRAKANARRLSTRKKK